MTNLITINTISLCKGRINETRNRSTMYCACFQNNSMNLIKLEVYTLLFLELT
jgi:hypothetical protein